MKFRTRCEIREIEAEQFFPETLPWPKGVVERETECGPSCKYCKYWLPSGLSKTMIDVHPGDWIITYADGVQVPCGDDSFHKNWEAVQ